MHYLYFILVSKSKYGVLASFEFNAFANIYKLRSLLYLCIKTVITTLWYNVYSVV